VTTAEACWPFDAASELASRTLHSIVRVPLPGSSEIESKVMLRSAV